jgi:hypothetical protein
MGDMIPIFGSRARPIWRSKAHVRRPHLWTHVASIRVIPLQTAAAARSLSRASTAAQELDGSFEFVYEL